MGRYLSSIGKRALKQGERCISRLRPGKAYKAVRGKIYECQYCVVVFLFSVFFFKLLNFMMLVKKMEYRSIRLYFFGNRNIRSMAVKKLLFKSHLMTINFHRVRQSSIIIYFVYLSRRVRQTRDSHNLAQSYQQIGEIGHED